MAASRALLGPCSVPMASDDDRHALFAGLLGHLARVFAGVRLTVADQQHAGDRLAAMFRQGTGQRVADRRLGPLGLGGRQLRLADRLRLVRERRRAKPRAPRQAGRAVLSRARRASSSRVAFARGGHALEAKLAGQLSLAVVVRVRIVQRPCSRRCRPARSSARGSTRVW